MTQMAIPGTEVKSKKKKININTHKYTFAPCIDPIQIMKNALNDVYKKGF